MSNLFTNPVVVAITVAGALLILAFVYLLSRKGVHQSSGADKFEELFLKIREEIKSAVAPKFVTVTIEANEITDLAIEVWRIEQRITKSASSLPENQLKGLENSIQKLRRYLEKYDIEIVDYKNHKYNDGLNLDILSVEKDPTLPESIVKETVEPTIMLKGQVVRKAKIILLSNH
ncbi:MAG: nucleotide exchange factor GrpE [Candidatus Harrisonbacteria bacterium]|nr:nucleotide exchange factor GrpE [Candidatus Harrisonbacteria bacterium]